MDTNSPDLSSRWKSTRYPPPLKPLPPLPNTKYLTLPKPLSNEPLLSHPVPSPLLRFDVMTLPSEPASYASSPMSSAFSGASHRDSTSSIVEFAQSLLPPLPTRVRPFNTKDIVDCRLQEPPKILPEHSAIFSETKQTVTSDHLHGFYPRRDNAKMGRRDSAMFDITLMDRSCVGPCRFESRSHHDNPIVPKMIDTNEVLEPEINIEGSTRGLRSIPLSGLDVHVQAETSFIDWDDEVPRLARMKKSIADLKNGSRLRSNSAPMASAKSPTLSSNATMTTASDASVVKTGHRISQTQTHPTQSYNFHTFPKRKHTRYRRTIFLVENTTRAARPNYQRTNSSLSTTSIITTKGSRASATSSIQTSHRRGGLNKLTSWMKRFIHCS